MHLCPRNSAQLPYSSALTLTLNYDRAPTPAPPRLHVTTLTPTCNQTHPPTVRQQSPHRSAPSPNFLRQNCPLSSIELPPSLPAFPFFTNETAPHSQRTFALVCACLCYIHLPLRDNRNQSEFIRAYQNQSDFLRLVLIDSDKFRFIISNIPPAPYHPQPPQPPQQRTHAYT